jgi:hypothetical protein
VVDEYGGKMIDPIKALKSFLSKVSYKVQIASYDSIGMLVREGPPGKLKPPDDLELHRWFSSLKEEEQEKILEILNKTIKLTIFNFLVLLDNKASGQPVEDKVSDFGLYLHTYESNSDRFNYKPDETIRLNMSYTVNGDLHEAYDYESNETSEI